MHDDGATVEVFDTGSPAVFAWHRSHPRFGDLVGLANVGDRAVDVMRRPGIDASAIDLLAPGDPRPWRVESLGVRWISADVGYPTVPAAGRAGTVRR
jgi:hypothetical protein